MAISRHGQEIAVIIPASDYYAVAEELEELRLVRLEFIDHLSYSAKIDVPSTTRNNGKGRIPAKPSRYLLDNHLCGYRSK